MFKLLHDADLNLGQDVEVKLKAKNNNKKYSRTVKAVTFNFQRQKYTGEIVKLVKSEKCEGEKELKPGQGGCLMIPNDWHQLEMYQWQYGSSCPKHR